MAERERCQTVAMNDHILTVTAEGRHGYRVNCSCERLSVGVIDFDLGITIKVHLYGGPPDQASASAPSTGRTST